MKASEVSHQWWTGSLTVSQSADLTYVIFHIITAETPQCSVQRECLSPFGLPDMAIQTISICLCFCDPWNEPFAALWMKASLSLISILTGLYKQGEVTGAARTLCTPHSLFLNSQSVCLTQEVLHVIRKLGYMWRLTACCPAPIAQSLAAGVGFNEVRTGLLTLFLSFKSLFGCV